MTTRADRRDHLGAAQRRRRLKGDDRQRLPLAIVILALVALAFLAIPVVAILQRAPWRSLIRILREEKAATALRLSLETATATTVICLVFGTPLAWALARGRFPGRTFVRAVALLPLVLPPVAGGVALLAGLGRRGLVGQYLQDWFGFSLPFSTRGVVVAQSFVAMPFLILTVEGALRAHSGGLEEAAATLGAGRWTVMRRITLPAIAPSLAAGAVLCWARALGEFGATIIFAGNYPGTTQTMPIVVSLALDDGTGQATALAVVLLAVSLIILIALRDKWLRPGPAA
ncbi:MAG: molybdenum transporter permease [Pseudonocardiales bacterium]|nr:molybdenum transporter permease [Pseudonocardiales bacterium]